MLTRPGLAGNPMTRSSQDAFAPGDVEKRPTFPSYRALAEYAPDIITVLSPDGQIHYESPSVERALGYEPDQLIGRNVFELVHPEDRELLRAALKECHEDPDTVEIVEYRRRHVDGSWIHLESSGRRPPSAAEIDGVLLHERDVMERKKLEEGARKTRKMEAVGRLVSGIAHDFNNLLTVVTGNTDLLLHEIDESDPRHTNVAEIREAAQRAATFTRDLMAFARQENLHLQTVDLVAAFEEMRSEIQEALGDAVTLDLQLTPGPARVRVDPVLARQVLLEVVSNARDAMPEGGRFGIEVRKVHVAPDSRVAARGVEAGEWVAIGYSDTGMGMTEAVKERALEPFFSTKEERSGLGLSTIYGLVKQSDGEIWIESTPGEGTTVWIYLPNAGTSAD